MYWGVEKLSNCSLDFCFLCLSSLSLLSVFLFLADEGKSRELEILLVEQLLSGRVQLGGLDFSSVGPNPWAYPGIKTPSCTDAKEPIGAVSFIVTWGCLKSRSPIFPCLFGKASAMCTALFAPL